MTDDEILEKLREHFQTKVSNLSGDEMAEGPFEDGTEDGELWEQAASRIDARGGLRIRFEFADDDPALTATAQQREERAVAEARPHDDEVIALRPGQLLTCFGRSARVTETAIEFHVEPGLHGNVMRLADEGGSLVLREGGDRG